MWNPFKAYKRYRKMRELKDVVRVFTILENLARRGMIFWNAKDKTLLIEQSLATLQLAGGHDAFVRFINRISAWQHYRLMQDAYENYRIEVEAEAVRKAKAGATNELTDMDIMRIRQHARMTLPELDPETLPFPKEFDIFIISQSASVAQTASEAAGSLIAVGHFDGKKVELAMYEDLKTQIINPDNDDADSNP